jgi:uncharacterized cupin superfamily protein
MSDWFVVNVADATAFATKSAGAYVPFESKEAPFQDFGINIHLLKPGQPNAKYHSEGVQEDFLVLAGEAIAIIDDEEHPLRAWDFVHCPAGVAHVFIGAGDGPCAILMVGARRGGRDDIDLEYPVNERAARYGASSPETTPDPALAYSDWDRDRTPTRLDWPPS